jgi:hypothetical protein
MAKTAAMMPPRYFVLANSAVITALSGSEDEVSELLVTIDS